MTAAPKVISLFSGAGGLDLGFQQAGFEIVFAIDNDQKVKDTYEEGLGHPILIADLRKMPSETFPPAIGIIGGPPCQSWSLAGGMRGDDDQRGQLFYEYIRIIRNINPLFFLAENVAGLVSATHQGTFHRLINQLSSLGYDLQYAVLNLEEYGVPQLRRRLFIVGVRQDYQFKGGNFFQTLPISPIFSLRKAIGDLESTPPHPKKNGDRCTIAQSAPFNHEYLVDSFSSRFMARNRVKGWDEPAYTILASGRHINPHPSAYPMIKTGPDSWIFSTPFPRRLSVRECARIQTFPDSFRFHYSSILHGYKMIGNAVPPKIAKIIAIQLRKFLSI